MLDGWGGLHQFTTGQVLMPQTMINPGYTAASDIHKDVMLNQSGHNGYDVIDNGHTNALGTSVPFWGFAPAMTTQPTLSPRIAHAMTAYVDDSGFILDGWGGRHVAKAFPADVPPPAEGGIYIVGYDILRDLSGQMEA